MKHITFWRIYSAISIILGAISAFVRFYYGLGAATALSDKVPWGLWVGIDILTGVALAAGGFIFSTAVYIFGLERYRPLVRPAILTACLGYLFFVIGLLVELGRPWNIWHALIYWNIHSPLFEIAWCVMLYTSILLVEVFIPILERLGWTTLKRALHKALPLLVIAGAALSTLHQSSLGTLYVLMVGKMHPLWYSPVLPLIFFASCICAGLAMVMVEAFFSERFLHQKAPIELLSALSRPLVIALLAYTSIRLIDIVQRGAFSAMTAEEAFAFFVELTLFHILPVLLLISHRNRASPRRLFVAAFSVVLGLVAHRLNVAITSFGLAYFPTWMEFAVTNALVVAAFWVFRLLARYTFDASPRAAHIG